MVARSSSTARKASLGTVFLGALVLGLGTPAWAAPDHENAEANPARSARPAPAVLLDEEGPYQIVRDDDRPWTDDDDLADDDLADEDAGDSQDDEADGADDDANDDDDAEDEEVELGGTQETAAHAPSTRASSARAVPGNAGPPQASASSSHAAPPVVTARTGTGPITPSAASVLGLELVRPAGSAVPLTAAVRASATTPLHSGEGRVSEPSPSGGGWSDGMTMLAFALVLGLAATGLASSRRRSHTGTD